MVDFSGCIFLLLILLVSTILVQSIFRRIKTTYSLPPSPMALSIIGHLHLLAPIPHQALHKLSIRYGPLIHLFLGSVPCVVACSPETAKEILKTHETSFCDRPISVAVDCLTYGSADFAFAPYGPYWKFMKKLCMTQLLGGQTLNQFIPIRSEEIRRFMQFMLKKAKASEAVDVGKELIRLVNNVVSVENSSHGSHDLSQSTDDLNDTVACHLRYSQLQSADERNERNSMRWQNSYTEEYQHMG